MPLTPRFSYLNSFAELDQLVPCRYICAANLRGQAVGGCHWARGPCHTTAPVWGSLAASA